MAEIGTATVKIVPELDGVFRLVIAATRLHEAIYHASDDVLKALPADVLDAYGDVQRAIKHITSPTPRIPGVA